MEDSIEEPLTASTDVEDSERISSTSQPSSGPGCLSMMTSCFPPSVTHINAQCSSCYDCCTSSLQTLDEVCPPLPQSSNTKRSWKRVGKNCTLLGWLLLLILLLPIFLLYAIGWTLVFCLSPIMQFLISKSFFLLANSLYITRLGRLLHKREKIKMSSSKLQSHLKEGSLPGHARSVCLPCNVTVEQRPTSSVHVHSIAVLGDNLNYLV
eukprot:GHVH01016667.1.p1 GENE.GHVH01016667.1~~GHVH01016667.1.p1  ORF type:complete len:218 (+),score=12.13 GHVH01016667.1:30-656(+)